MKKKHLTFLAISMACTIVLLQLPIICLTAEEPMMEEIKAANKSVELYRTFSNRLQDVAGKDYKRAHMNNYVDLFFIGGTAYTEKGDDGKYKHYATVADGGYIWKGNHATYGSASNALYSVKVTWEAIDEGAYFELLTAFDGQSEYGLTPATADISYTLESAVGCVSAGNYFTLIAHGAMNLTSIYMYYHCDNPVDKGDEVIEATDVVAQVGTTAQIYTSSSFGNGVTFTYESEDPSIATVDSDGVVTGVATGTTSITITSSLGNVKSVGVEVSGKTIINALLLANSGVYAQSANSVYNGATSNFLTATRKGSNQRHVYLKFNAADILDGYANLSPTKQNAAKIHLKINAYLNLSTDGTYQASDISAMGVRGMAPAGLVNQGIVDWDPAMITWARTKSGGEYDAMARSGADIPLQSESVIDFTNNCVDLYYSYSAFSTYFYNQSGATYGYVTIAFTFTSPDTTHTNFTIYTSKTSAKQPVLSLEA